MNDRNNKTSICSIVFLDIIDYSKKTDSEQIEIKNQFNALINHALKDLAENDRIILDSGDGAAIASNGSPEDVLFIALNVRDVIIKSNITSTMPLYVRFGVNLGPVRVVKDINGRPNIIGDGINVAQRIMSFAKPNQILVSRSYYEVTSRLTQEISQMFDYFGVKQDKHEREHEVYSVRLLKEQDEEVYAPQVDMETAGIFSASKKINWAEINAKINLAKTSISQYNFTQAFNRLNLSAINWKYVALTLPALVAFILIINSAITPIEPVLTVANKDNKQVALVSTAEAKTVDINPFVPPAIAVKVEKTGKDLLLPNETIEIMPLDANLPKNDAMQSLDAKKVDIALVEKTPQELLDLERAKKKAKQKAKKKAEDAAQKALESKAQFGTVHNHDAATAKIVAKKEPTQKSIDLNTLKNSKSKAEENGCSQAQIAMHQCN